MEVSKSKFGSGLNNSFLKEPVPFTNKRDINWRLLKNCALVSIIIGVLILLMLPNPELEVEEFQEERQLKSPQAEPQMGDASDSWQDMQLGNAFGKVPSGLDHLYSNGVDKAQTSDQATRNASMIIRRSGEDASTHLPPGTRIQVRLYERVVVSDQAMPVIGVVEDDFIQGNSVAVPRGSKLFGNASFWGISDRAQINWATIRFPDGRERPLSALSVDSDGQMGVSGEIHSNSVQNTVGQTLTRFIGAYAEGSMSKGAMGASRGGHENGLKNAIAETAKDRAQDWADDMKKEKRWIEIVPAIQFFAVLNQSFAFRDPGATYGQ